MNVGGKRHLDEILLGLRKRPSLCQLWAHIREAWWKNTSFFFYGRSRKEFDKVNSVRWKFCSVSILKKRFQKYYGHSLCYRAEARVEFYWQSRQSRLNLSKVRGVLRRVHFSLATAMCEAVATVNKTATDYYLKRGTTEWRLRCAHAVVTWYLTSITTSGYS